VSDVNVVGLDLSMTATGLVRIERGDISSGVIKSKPDDGTLRGFIRRSNVIAASVLEGIDRNTLVVIEGMSFQSKSKVLDKIHAHWWNVVRIICSVVDTEPVVVSPNARAKYATGKGNASKDTVLASVIKRYADVNVTDNNIADALVLAGMGARFLGHPIDDLPALNLTAMDAIKWPITDLGEDR
jgi:crossover junction endodeoxyribonuclease RuvC